MMFGRRTHRRNRELAPDEIFLDSSNLPDFDQDRLEGRLEKPLSSGSVASLSIIAALMFTALIVQAANLEIVQGDAYAAKSERNRLRPELIFAERGAILDRTGEPLVTNEASTEGAPTRVYKTPGFAHLLGYVSYPKKDSSGNYYDYVINGMAGVEDAFNESLSGENGTLLVEEDALGNVESQGTIVPAKNGQTLTLSIDARVQQAFYSAISSLADKVPFQGGAGVLMDAQTGELYALVSYPEYDPNILSAGTPAEVIAGYQNDPRQPYLDRPVSGLYTPGSIVKPLIAAGAYNDGIIDPETIIVSTGALVFPNPYDPENPTIFKDWKALGPMNMRSAIAYSSDVYFYTITGGFEKQNGLGIERLAYWYRAFGLTKETGIELPGEASGFVPTPAWKEETYDEPWRIGNTYHTGIGQYAMQISILEAVRSIAAVANGGKLVKPTLVKDAPLAGESIAINLEGLQIAREGMRMGATEGTSVGLNDLSFVELAGKTGTAELGLHKEWYNSWAVGFFPYDNPKYVYAVVMEKGPAGNSTGGIYVMHQVLSEMHRTAPEYFD